jgi:hypothetical protein
MPIRKHLTDQTAFGPAAIEAMSKAFEEACIALQVFAGDEKGREIIATLIIDLARGAMVDADALRVQALTASAAAKALVQQVGEWLRRVRGISPCFRRHASRRSIKGSCIREPRRSVVFVGIAISVPEEVRVGCLPRPILVRRAPCANYLRCHMSLEVDRSLRRPESFSHGRSKLAADRARMTIPTSTANKARRKAPCKKAAQS